MCETVEYYALAFCEFKGVMCGEIEFIISRDPFLFNFLITKMKIFSNRL